MNARHALIVPALAGLLFLPHSGRANTPAGLHHWPQWRGPLANGVAPAANPPLSWSETNNVKWKFAIPGRGTSTPIIWEDRVFILTAVPAGQPAEGAAPGGAGNSTSAAATRESPDPRRRGGPGGTPQPEQPTEPHAFTVLALDRHTGRLLWERVARTAVPHEGHHRDHGYASFSPVTDGEWLFAWFGSRGLYAYDLAGNLKWEKDLGDMQTRNSFGEGNSPALHGDVLVVQWDHEGEDFIVALDKRTGRELWRRERDEPTTWSTPLVVVHAGRTQVVANATQRIRSYDLHSGELLWECGGMTQNVIPSPVSDGERVYVLSGFRGAALLAIRLGYRGDLSRSPEAIAWRHGRNTPYVPSPLLYEGRLYFYSGNNAMLSVFEAAGGKPLVEAERLGGLSGVYASPLGAAGRVYLVGRDGNTLVIRHGDRLEVLSTNRLDDRFDASPAAAGRELYLRGHRHLYCLAETEG
jgi:outer membrane protein assembly factor BamB